jgi:hypothetical protein
MHIVLSEPPRPGKYDELHPTGIRILHFWRDFSEHTGTHTVSAIIYRKMSVSFKNIVDPCNLPAYHEGVVPAVDFHVINIDVLLLQRSERITKKTFTVKRPYSRK